MMTNLKPIHQQVVVIIGATKGIGRSTAIRMSRQGVSLVLAARGRKGLQSLVDKITAEKGNAIMVPADVCKMEDLQKVAETAISKFGRIDTWIHTPSVVVWSKVMDTTEDEYRKVMDVIFLGVTRSIQVALPHLKKQGGSLIIVSSIAGKRGVPTLGAYSASKHAVEGLLDALRVELMQENSNVSVTAIHPATINTPVYDQARNKYSTMKLMGPPPRYDPKIVARSIEYAATHPGIRDLPVGTAAWLLNWMQSLCPYLVDFISLISMRFFLLREPASKVDNLEHPIDTEEMNTEICRAKITTAHVSVYNMIRESAPVSLLDHVRYYVRMLAGRMISTLMGNI